jgi:penicillin amidase
MNPKTSNESSPNYKISGIYKILLISLIVIKERLFQMAMLRRVAAGRLAEILGEELVKTDKFFRTIGILERAEINAATYFKDPSSAFQKAALAYLAGINQFVEIGETPIEFRRLGIPREKFTPKDIYLTGALVAFGFASGFRMDPLLRQSYCRSSFCTHRPQP